MKTLRIIPGAIVSPNAHTLPTGAPLIDRVIAAAEITRIVDTITLAHNAGAVIAHVDGAVVAHANMAVNAHAAHMHDIITFGAAGAPAGGVLGWDAIAPPTQLEDSAAVGTHTFAGGGATGIQDGVLDAHVVVQADAHTPAETIAGLGDHTGALVAASQGNHAVPAVTPVVAAVATRLTARTFSLNVNTLVGDLLTLYYVEVGERTLVG